METLAEFLAVAATGQTAGIPDASKMPADASKSLVVSIPDASKSRAASIASMADASNMLADANEAENASIPDASKMPADASSRGRAGGKARVASMSREDRSELARRAAQARWKKARKSLIGFARQDGMPD